MGKCPPALFVFRGVFWVPVTNAVSNGESFIKFGIEGVEVFAVQVVLNYSEPVAETLEVDDFTLA